MYAHDSIFADQSSIDSVYPEKDGSDDIEPVTFRKQLCSLLRPPFLIRRRRAACGFPRRAARSWLVSSGSASGLRFRAFPDHGFSGPGAGSGRRFRAFMGPPGRNGKRRGGGEPNISLVFCKKKLISFMRKRWVFCVFLACARFNVILF